MTEDIRQANVARFEAEMKKVGREGVDGLMEYIRTYDMYTAPASTKFHLCVPGGLLQHSLNVLDALRSILTPEEDGTYSYYVAGKAVASGITEESVIIMGLLHDLCKTRFYTTEKRNRKNKDGQWEQYDYYTVDDQSPYGHGEKSVYIIQSYMRLEKEELYAIRWHMGMPDTDKWTFTKAVDLYPVVWALVNADMLAAHCMEGAEDNLPAFRAEAEAAR